MRSSAPFAGWAPVMAALAALAPLAACACSKAPQPATETLLSASAEPTPPPSCTFVERGYGPRGTASVRAETVVTGLDVPWSLAFLPNGDVLVTERPGRIRLVHEGSLLPAPVATLPVSHDAEGGLLGLALDPGFTENRRLFVYYTAEAATARSGAAPATGGRANRVERWRLAEDGRTARLDRVVFEGIAAAPFHDGGRLRVGPDRLLYVGTGDARQPDLSQSAASPNGKILRLTLDGAPAPGNPSGGAAFISGVRNVQAFDWIDERTLVVADHGPSGELGLRGEDEVSLARAGDDLGWPKIHGCGAGEGMVTPAISWREAAPPGGAAIYDADAIEAWRGSLLVATLGSKHLHRVALDRATGRVTGHDVYFEGDPPSGLGRLRDVVLGPDRQLYVTTSNCDGRGRCPPDRDRILRIVPR